MVTPDIPVLRPASLSESASDIPAGSLHEIKLASSSWILAGLKYQGFASIYNLFSQRSASQGDHRAEVSRVKAR
jgi:hypothetical protein